LGADLLRQSPDRVRRRFYIVLEGEYEIFTDPGQQACVEAGDVPMTLGHKGLVVGSDIPVGPNGDADVI
jgi:hypothetical protein